MTATAVPADQWPDKWTRLASGERYRIEAPKAGRVTKSGRRSLSRVRFCDEYGSRPKSAAQFAQSANITARLRAGTYRHGHSVLLVGSNRGSLV